MLMEDIIIGESPFLFNSNKDACNSVKLRGDYYKIT